MARCAMSRKICHVVFDNWTDTVRKSCPIGFYDPRKTPCENREDSICIYYGSDYDIECEWLGREKGVSGR